ncbi:hypothetical protein [Streptomyces sp. NPDC020141]|uniref:hypothetical protein n=1 Tax=Streptomyces sp. NPDC020141 TaxID=3365065 RepID=UPI00378939B7
MDAFLPFLIVVGGFAVVLFLFARLAARIRRRGLAGGAMSAALASYEEAFRATSHESYVEIRAQTERKAPVLSPDGHRGRGPGATGRADAADVRRRGPHRPGRPRARRSRRLLGLWTGRPRSGR